MIIVISRLVQENKCEKRTKELGVQTCTRYEDVIPPNKELTYKWNIWDLKREAVCLVSKSFLQDTHHMIEYYFGLVLL